MPAVAGQGRFTRSCTTPTAAHRPQHTQWVHARQAGGSCGHCWVRCPKQTGQATNYHTSGTTHGHAKEWEGRGTQPANSRRHLQALVAFICVCVSFLHPACHCILTIRWACEGAFRVEAGNELTGSSSTSGYALSCRDSCTSHSAASGLTEAQPTASSAWSSLASTGPPCTQPSQQGVCSWHRQSKPLPLGAHQRWVPGPRCPAHRFTNHQASSTISIPTQRCC